MDTQGSRNATQFKSTRFDNRGRESDGGDVGDVRKTPAKTRKVRKPAKAPAFPVSRPSLISRCIIKINNNSQCLSGMMRSQKQRENEIE